MQKYIVVKETAEINGEWRIMRHNTDIILYVTMLNTCHIFVKPHRIDSTKSEH